MKISGLQKLTLLDYPGKVACTVFLDGCNFRCPFCHNSELLSGQAPQLMDAEALLDFLRKRTGLLEGVCVSGGEPTLQPDLAELLRQIKALGFLVKLDTNGYRPEVLRTLVYDGLVDYVAMDIKDAPERYAATAGVTALDLQRILDSMRFLIKGAVDYEFRTTVVDELHSEDSFTGIVQLLRELSPAAPVRRYFLQPFVDRDTVCFSNFHAPAAEKLAQYRSILRPAATLVEIRGA